MNQIMKKITVLALLFINVTISAQVESNELDRIADDARFENAYYFVKIGRTKKAVQFLGEYIEVYQDGIHRKAAIMAIGDLYFDQFEYQRAINYYSILFEEFPNAQEGIEAYYCIGLSWVKMGDRKRADQIFDDIVQNYSSFPAAEKARLEQDISAILGQ